MTTARLFFGWVPELFLKFRRDFFFDIFCLRLIVVCLISETAEFRQVSRVLGKYLGCRVDVNERAVPVDAALKRHRGAAHQRCKEGQRNDEIEFFQGSLPRVGASLTLCTVFLLFLLFFFTGLWLGPPRSLRSKGESRHTPVVVPAIAIAGVIYRSLRSLYWRKGTIAPVPYQV